MRKRKDQRQIIILTLEFGEDRKRLIVVHHPEKALKRTSIIDAFDDGFSIRSLATPYFAISRLEKQAHRCQARPILSALDFENFFISLQKLCNLSNRELGTLRIL